jgi:hypothetical protein
MTGTGQGGTGENYSKALLQLFSLSFHSPGCHSISAGNQPG